MARDDRRSASDLIAEQHHTIHSLCELMQSGGELATFLDRVTELRVLLAEHFRVEESPGGMADVVRSGAADAGNRLQHLFAEHPLMLDAVDGLEAQVRDALARSEQLIGLIREHERQEADLLTDALYSDLGEGD